MPLSHAVLALLVDGPSHGYELKGRFERSIGPQWGGLNIGHLYQILDRLVRDGLVVRHHVTQSERPDKFAYELTERGAAELENWATSPHVRRGGYRDELFLKLLGATRLGSSALRSLLSAQRAAYLAELGALTKLRTAHSDDDPFVALLVEAAIRHTEADLHVLDAVEERHLETVKESVAVQFSASVTTTEVKAG